MDDPVVAAAPAPAPVPKKEDMKEEKTSSGGGGVFGWFQGKLSARNLASNLDNLDMKAMESGDDPAATSGGDPSDLNVVMGLEKDKDDDDEFPRPSRDGVRPADQRPSLGFQVSVFCRPYPVGVWNYSSSA